MGHDDDGRFGDVDLYPSSERPASKTSMDADWNMRSGSPVMTKCTETQSLKHMVAIVSFFYSQHCHYLLKCLQSEMFV